MILGPPRSTQGVSSAASDVDKRQGLDGAAGVDGLADVGREVGENRILGYTESAHGSPLSVSLAGGCW